MVDGFSEKVDFIWSVADLLRGDYKQHEYREVILPLTVLRRLDCVTQPSKEEVLERYEELQESGVDNVDPTLKRVSGSPVYNTSQYTFESLCEDSDNLDENLRYYIQSFDPDTREVVEKFEFGNQIDRLEENDLLYKVVSRFTEIDLNPDEVPNEEIGYIYEELIRKFSEISNETAGEHFTPREVIRLMVNLLFNEDDDILTQPGVIRTLYDPACGTGGMLSVAEDYLRELNEDAKLHTYGQELNPESYAVCKSDMLIKGHDPENIVHGNSFSEDGFSGKTFDYMLTNPPFGVSWNKVEDEVKKEHEEMGHDGRFGAGTPRKSDGQLLFLQHMLSKTKDKGKGGSRLAIVFNGSPLFSGGPNSGESNIRRWIIENDWLEAIVALPDKLFYNTGIHTFIWVLTNRKPEDREGEIQLIDARDLYNDLRRNLGDKSHELSDEHIDTITREFGSLSESDRSKLIPNKDFGYRRIVVDQPLRLNFKITEERLDRLEEQRAFTNRDEETQDKIIQSLEELDSDEVWEDAQEFRSVLKDKFEENGMNVRQSVYNAIERSLGERDPDAQIVRDKNGNPKHDTNLREYERVPLEEDPHEYFKEEVEPYIPEGWINEDSRYHDEKDGKLGQVGYEINFDRYFYEYEPPRAVEEIDGEIRELNEKIMEKIREMSE
jgi:type I restriction enzyme M protein